MKNILFITIIIGAVLLSGCSTTCDEPYKLIGEVCCTDENANWVCDVEELDVMEEETEDFAMKEAEYVGEPAELPEPEVESEVEPEVEPAVEPPAVEIDVPKPVPEIDKSFDVKVDEAKDLGYIPASGKKEPIIKAVISDFQYGLGRFSNFNVEFTLLGEDKITPRIHVLLKDGDEWRKIKTLYYTKLVPSYPTREYEDNDVYEDVPDEDITLKFEVLYYRSQTGLVLDSEQIFDLPKKR
ncbi:hypothetical protein ACFL0V_01505 [Nanoarchaeota archaeon]